MYYAIIGDIIDSKKIKNRSEVQEKLHYCLEAINNDYQKYLKADFIITLGDEFQGLFKNPAKIFEIILKIQLSINPYKVRFGIGIGEVTTKVNSKMSIGSDGPVWWNARNMITELKQNERGLRGVSDIKVSGIKNVSLMDLININLSLLHSIEQKWTNDQKQIIEYIISNYGLTDDFIQKEIAEKLNISTVNLNKKLKLSLFYDYLKTKELITKLLENEGI